MSLIHRLLQRLMGVAARLVCARPGLILTVGLLLAVGSVVVLATRFEIINNTSQLLSDKLESKKQFNELIKDFGSDYRFIILIKSEDPAKNRQVADEVGPYLESLKPQINMVLDKIDFSAIKPRLLFTREQDELKKIATEVEAQRDAQKSDASNQQVALDLNSILDEANKKFDDSYLRDKKNWTDFKPFVKQFVSVLNKVSAQASGKAPVATNDEQGGLDDFDGDEMLAQHEYFSLEKGKAILLFAYTGESERDGPFDVTEKIRQHFKELEAKYPGVTIGLTGEPALDTDQINLSFSDSMKALAITAVLIIILFFFSYNAFERPAFTFSALIIGVLWSLALGLLLVGHFNVLSVAVIPMVLGIGIDFGIQILGRYEEELALGRTVHQSVTAAMQHTGVAIMTGGSTTAIAFFTLCFNEFSGLAELGVIAGFSMVLCIGASLLVLPAIFVLWDRNRSPESLKAQSSNTSWRFIQTWDHDMVRTPWLWIAISVVISVISILSLTHLKFDYNLLHLQNQSAESVKVLYQVMDASKNDDGNEISTIYASIVTDNLDEARDLSDKLSKLPEVAKVDSILQLVPADQDQKMPLIKRIVDAASSLNVKPATSTNVDIPKAQKDIANLLIQAREALKQAQAYAAVSKVAKDAVAAFAEMVPALERADKALNSASVETIKERFSASSNGAFSRMQKNMELLKSQKADRGLTLADIPPQLQKLYVAPNGKILLQVYGKEDLWKRGPDEKFTLAVTKVAPKATGSPVLNYYATDLLRVSYLKASLWSFLAIVILIFFHFQSFKYLLLTITPLVLAVLWRTGAMVWFGLDFNPANIVTLPLIIGIDVAFGVYIIDRYREDGKLSIFAGSTGKAIIMSALTSLFGFSSLLISQFTGMFSIGQLMTLGIAIGLVTAIFILPQILSLLEPGKPESDEELKLK